MKRSLDGMAGGPRHRASSRSSNEMAGRSGSSSSQGRDGSSFLLRKERGPEIGPRPKELEEGVMSEEFADFLVAEAAYRSAPDPVFQERLRQRLWRLHLMTRGPHSSHRH